MKKASTVAISVTTFFYLCCSCFGYAAFGDATPGNLLSGSAFYEPFWLVSFANACVVLHLLGGYQVLLLLYFSFDNDFALFLKFLLDFVRVFCPKSILNRSFLK